MIRDAETLEQLVDTVTKFVSEQLVPCEYQVEETNAIPEEIIRGMRALGLFGLAVPEEYGGLGLTMSEEVRVAMALGRTSPAFRSVIGTNNGIGSHSIIIDGTDEQKRHYLPKLASGELIASFALTEPEAGSDPGALRASARRDGDSYVINGTKRFITNAPVAGLFTVFARSNPELAGAAGVSAFLVEAGTPGLSVGKPDKKMGQRGALTSDISLDDCHIPASAIVGGPALEGKGFKTAMKVLDRSRIHIAAVCVGIAERLIQDSVTYAMERKQFGKPIGEFQLVQAMLADSRTEAYAGRCMVADAARRKDAGEDVTGDAACCKYYCSEMVGRVADRAVQVYGGAGYIADYGVERFYRDVRLFRIYEGTSQIQQLIIARDLIRSLT